MPEQFIVGGKHKAGACAQRFLVGLEPTQKVKQFRGLRESLGRNLDYFGIGLAATGLGVDRAD